MENICFVFNRKKFFSDGNIKLEPSCSYLYFPLRSNSDDNIIAEDE